MLKIQKPNTSQGPSLLSLFIISSPPQGPFGRREWNGIKIIFLEYSSLLLFGSFNGVNGMSIPLFGSLSGREWNGQERMLIPPFSLKTSNFCSPKNWEEWEGMDLGLMKFLLKSLKYPFNISPFFSFSHKKIQLSFLHMLPVLCKVKLLPLVFLFLLSAAIFGYWLNQVCLSFSFSFRLFASLYFYIYIYIFYELFAMRVIYSVFV